MEFECVPVNLWHEVHSIGRVYRAVSSFKGVQINVIIRENTPEFIFGDPHR